MPTPDPRPRRPRSRWSMLPALLAVGGVVLANAGIAVVGSASAVTDTIAVNAGVASASSVSDGCALANSSMVPSGADADTNGTAAAGTTLTMSAFNWGWCDVSFGATNNSALPLQVADAAGAGGFFSTNPSGFTEDAGTACDAALTAGEVGFKVATGGTSTINVCAATATTADSNLDYTKFPDALTTVCTTTATGNQTCRVAVGILTGASATSGSNSGTINLSA